MSEFEAPICREKRDLRVRLLAARRARPPGEVARLDADLLATLGAWLDRFPDRPDAGPDQRQAPPEADPGRGPGPGNANPARPVVVTGYAPLTGEPGGPGLLATLAAHAGRVLLPVLRPDNDLDWAEYRGELVPGPRGLAEPPGPRLGVAAIGTARVILVPALAVDTGAVRLGRGGGSYDRALRRVAPDATVLALLYPGELVDHVPAATHDRRVHGVVQDGRVRLL